MGVTRSKKRKRNREGAGGGEERKGEEAKSEEWRDGGKSLGSCKEEKSVVGRERYRP